MRKTIIAIFLVCMVAIGIAGASGGIGLIGSTEPIVKDKVIPDTEYQELKTVLTRGGVVIDDKIGLDVQWKETKCTENFNQDINEETQEPIGEKVLTSTTCEYALYKENLFNGATIQVTYAVNEKAEVKQVQLETAIQEKINAVKEVWVTRQAKADDLNKEVQTGTTNIISDKLAVPIK